MRGRNVKRFRGGLVCKAHRLLNHSTLGLRVIKKKKNARQGWAKPCRLDFSIKIHNLLKSLTCRNPQPFEITNLLKQGWARECRRRHGERCRRPWLVANWATLPQKWPPPPRNVADSCELTAMTKTGLGEGVPPPPRGDGAASAGSHASSVEIHNLLQQGWNPKPLPVEIPNLLNPKP